jgi:APA family basic amino acid/polyamine antiporter
MMATGESAFSMGLTGDLPRIFARSRSGNIPYASHIISAALAISLVLANSSRSLNGLFVFTILLTSAGIMVFYIIGAAAAMKQAQTIKSRAIITIGLIFALFCLYGIGLEADLWSLATMIFGLALRHLIRKTQTP